jgi:hypothetical protein
VRAILAEWRHPEQGYRSCLGILRLARSFGRERLEAACARGMAIRARFLPPHRLDLEARARSAAAARATADPRRIGGAGTIFLDAEAVRGLLMQEGTRRYLSSKGHIIESKVDVGSDSDGGTTEALKRN